MNLFRFLSLSPVLAVALASPAVGQTPAPSVAPATPQSGPAAPASPAAPTSQQIAAMQHKLDDWPGLAHYRADNAKLSEAAPGETRVVFMGDSITDFWGRGHNHGVFFPGQPYVNRGISGQTTPQMLVRFQQDVIHLQPAVVVILAGINDIAGNTGPSTPEMIEDNLASMVALARANHIRVVLASILPASYFPWRSGAKPAETVRQVNLWIKDYCKREGLTYLDYYTAMVNDEGGIRAELAFDKAVHPNDAGYAIMQPLAEKAIADAMAAPAPWDAGGAREKKDKARR